MPTFDSEIEQLLEEGGVLHPSWGPKKIVANGKVNGIELVRCSRVFDESRRFNPSFDDPSVTTVIEADTVILAHFSTRINRLCGSREHPTFVRHLRNS